MARRYPCPHCAKEMLLEKVHEGFEVPCPGCGARFLVPAGAADDGVPAFPPPAAAGSMRDTSYVPPPRRSGDGDDGGGLILILGVLSIVVCSLLGPVAWYMGSRARTAARAEGREPTGTVTAGWVLGMVSTALTAIAVLGLIAVVLFAAASR